MKIQPSKKAGFTLTEIMIVVGIIGVLTPIAIPNFIKARSTSQANTCINNLRQIDATKQQWATETSQGTTAAPSSSDLKPYLGRGGGSLNNCYCPQDAGRSFDTSYTIGDLTVSPECIVNPASHKL
jgi:prepilin-type N-terminal cleavage/methylation domain-containing protein